MKYTSRQPAIALFTLLCIVCNSILFAEEKFSEVQIADPFLELHSGPGKGFPILYVEERGAWIEIHKRKTDWFKIRTQGGNEGWVFLDQLERTLSVEGNETRINSAGIQQFSFHRWEMGALGGDFENANILTLYGGYFFTPNFSAEGSIAKVFSDFSDAEMGSLSLSIHPYPGWRASPFFTLGTGVIHTNPKTTLIKESDRIDQLAHVGVGVRAYVARRFIFRAQYKNYVIFQSSDDNQEVNEWNAGFAVFF